MKAYRSAVVAVCVLAVMLICWFAVDRISVENKYNKDGERTEIINLEQTDIEEIEFENPEEKFTLVNNGTCFVIKERDIKADSYAVSSVLEKILKIDGKLIAQGCTDIAQYGLDSPKSVVSVRTHTKEVTLTLGNHTPAETEYYLMDEKGNVYTVYTSAGSGLASKRWQFTDLTLFAAAYDDIKAVSVNSENGFSAEKETAGVWKIESKNEGDYEVSDEKFRAKVGLYFENMYAKRLAENNEENRAAYGLDSPEGIVTVISRSGDKAEFKIFRDRDKQEAAVIKNDGEDIYITVDSYFDMLDIKKENLI